MSGPYRPRRLAAPSTTYNVQFTVEMLEALKEAAYRHKTSPAQIIRELVEAWLEDE